VLRIIKRVGIGASFIALNAAYFAFRYRPTGDPYIGRDITITDRIIIPLSATVCFVLLLHFVDLRNRWWFLIDAFILAILLVGANIAIGMRQDPYQDLHLLILVTLVFWTPIYAAINCLSLSLAMLIMWLAGKMIRYGRR
jgi:hypothetical protein